MDQIRDIRALICIADAGSFTGAARMLNISRSAVTKAVSRLESDYEIRLVNRTTHSISLTDAGEQFLTEARRIVEDLDHLRDNLVKSRNELGGQIRLGVPPVFANGLIYDALASFVAANKDVTLEIVPDNGALDIVREGLDFSIRIGNSLADTALKARRLIDLPQIFVASPSYLERHGFPKLPRDLVKHVGLINTSVEPGEGWYIPNEGHCAVRSSITAQQDDALFHLALAGAGIALLPQATVAQAVKDRRLQQILPGLRGISVSVFSLCSNRRFRPRRVSALIDHLARWMRKTADKEVPLERAMKNRCHLDFPVGRRTGVFDLDFVESLRDS